MLGELTYALFKFTHTLLKLNDAKCLRNNKHVTGIAGIGIGDCLRLMIMRLIEYRPPNLFAPTIKFSSPRKGGIGGMFCSRKQILQSLGISNALHTNKTPCNARGLHS